MTKKSLVPECEVKEYNMEEKRTRSKAVRKLMDYYSCDEEERRPTTSDSDTSQSDHKSAPVSVPRPRAHRGYCSDSSPCQHLPPIGVFWDIENCQIPRGRSAVAVAQAIRDKFFDGYREAEFLVVCDITKEVPQVIEELNNAQVNLIHVGSTCKNAADEKLRQSIRRFADLHGSLAAIILISGDINFAPDLCDLRHRKKIHVILVHNDLCSESLILCANEHYSFSSLVASLPYRGDIKSVYQAAEVAVNLLPVNADPGKVRQRLRRLAENCGGRVRMVVGESATVRFPSMEFAIRAQKRMDGEVVFGSKISVSQPTIARDQKPFNSPVKGFNKHSSAKRDEVLAVPLSRNQPDAVPLLSKTTLIPPAMPKFCGGSSQVPPRPYFNQENVPFPVSASNWEIGLDIPSRQMKKPQLANGRPILGRRNEPNHIHETSAHSGNVSGRHSLDSMLEGEMNGGLKPIPQLYVGLAQNNQERRKCQTPPACVTINTSIPPPPIVNLPRRNDSQYAFHPIQKPAVELKVTNLNELEGKGFNEAVLRDRVIFSALTKHCTVLSWSTVVGEEGKEEGRLRVSEEDWATLQHRVVWVGQSRLTITPAYDYPRFMQNALTPSPASSTEVGSGEPALCPLHSRPGRNTELSLPNVTVCLADFSTRIVSLVNNHDNRLPLASLPDCYGVLYETLRGDGPTVPLEHLVTCVPGVELVNMDTDGGEKRKYLRLCAITTAETATPVPENPKLAQFGQEMVELLTAQPDCQIMFDRLVPAYRHHFGRHCRTADYGCSKLLELLQTIPWIVQVMGEGLSRVVTLTHRTQARRFLCDLMKVVRSQASKQITLPDLPIIWQRIIGRPLEATEYGLCYIEDLLSLVATAGSNMIMTGVGAARVIAIPRRAQTQQEKERTKQFADQVVIILSTTPTFSMEICNFAPAYCQEFGSQIKTSDYGCNKLLELFELISHIVKVEGEGDARRITLVQGEKLKAVGGQLLQLVASRYPPGLPMGSLHSTYLWHFGHSLKPSLFQCKTLLDLLNKLTTVKVVKAADGAALLVPVDHKQLSLRALRILWERSSARMTRTDFEQHHLRYYMCPFNLLDHVDQLKDFVKMTPDGNVQLTSIQLFARDVYRVLCSHEGRLPLSGFESIFSRTLGTSLSPQQYGYSSPLQLLLAINHVVTVAGKGGKRVVTLNPQLSAVGIPVPVGLAKNNPNEKLAGKNGVVPAVVPVLPASSDILLKGLSVKKNEKGKTVEPALNNIVKNDKEKISTIKSNGNSKTYAQNKNPDVVPISEEKTLKLLSPAEFLLPPTTGPAPAPAPTLPFPSPPDPSTLPKPGTFNLTLKNKADCGWPLTSPLRCSSSEARISPANLAFHDFPIRS